MHAWQNTPFLCYFYMFKEFNNERLITRILNDIMVKVNDAAWYGEDGSMSVRLINLVRTVVEAFKTAKANEVLSSPAFPTEFQQTLVQQVA